jgi:hypothetical protein
MSLPVVYCWAEQHLRARHDHLRDDVFLNGCLCFFKSCGLGSATLNGPHLAMMMHLQIEEPLSSNGWKTCSDLTLWWLLWNKLFFQFICPGLILTHILSHIAALAQICRGELLRKTGKLSDILASKSFLYNMKSALSVRNLLFASLR